MLKFDVFCYVIQKLKEMLWREQNLADLEDFIEKHIDMVGIDRSKLFPCSGYIDLEKSNLEDDSKTWNE